MQISLWDPFFISFGYVLRSGIAEWYSSSIFYFLRNLHTVSTVTAPIYIPINSAQGYTFFFVSSCCLHLSLVFLRTAILKYVRWYLVVVLVCISLMISDGWAPFHVAFGHLYVIFGKVSYSVPMPILKSDFFYWVVWILYTFWY